MPVNAETQTYSVRSFYTAAGAAQGPKALPEITGQGPSSFAAYLADGEFRTLRLLLSGEGSSHEVLQQILASGLRGCGGAQIPLLEKWQAAIPNHPRYLVVNGMEGEPYTFKDYFLMRHYPQLLLEGIAITCQVLGIHQVVLALNGAYGACRDTLEGVLRQQAELFATLQIELVNGPELDLYVLGEETALLNYLEGKRGEPRLKPPYPHQRGLWEEPTLINNVETLSWIPILLSDPGCFAGQHPKLVTLLGDVARPGIYEVTLGEPLLAILQRAGADDLTFVEVGGVSGGLLPASLLATPYADDALAPLGVQVGSGTLRAFNTSRSPLQAMREAIDFFAAESCGRCTPCRVGTRELARFVASLGRGGNESEELHWLHQVAHTMRQTSTCGLGRAAPAPLHTYLRHFTGKLDD